MNKFGIVAIIIMGLGVAASAADGPKKPSLQEALAKLKVPPDWFNTTTVHWDMNKPWKEGRIEIRRLLAGSEQEVREGVKMTWLYAQKGDIGNGHELPMYLFMSGNYDWACVEYPKFLASDAELNPTHAYLCYASCLAHFGEYAKTMEILDKAAKVLPPPPWTIMNQATVHDRYGDLYAEMGDIEKAKQHYTEAIRLYPTSNQPYGRQLLPRRAAKAQAKLDMLVLQALDIAKLRQGTFIGKSLGYSDKQDIEVALTIKAGKIADVQVKHQEKIELGATRIIPQRIIEKQSLKVDAVTGATVTSQAIIDGTFAALKQAGLK